MRVSSNRKNRQAHSHCCFWFPAGKQDLGLDLTKKIRQEWMPTCMNGTSCINEDKYNLSKAILMEMIQSNVSITLSCVCMYTVNDSMPRVWSHYWSDVSLTVSLLTLLTNRVFAFEVDSLLCKYTYKSTLFASWV